jgi:hypothetical protein
VSNSGYPDVASAARGYASPQMKGTTMESTVAEKAREAATVAEKAREAATVAIGLIEVLLVPTRLSSAWERVAAAES